MRAAWWTVTGNGSRESEGDAWEAGQEALMCDEATGVTAEFCLNFTRRNRWGKCVQIGEGEEQQAAFVSSKQQANGSQNVGRQNVGQCPRASSQQPEARRQKPEARSQHTPPNPPPLLLFSSSSPPTGLVADAAQYVNSPCLNHKVMQSDE